MTRGATAAIATASIAEVVRPYLLIELDYASEATRVTSLPFNIVYDGDTYYGVGRFGRISEIEEGSEVKSYGAALSLSGIPLENSQDIIAENGQGRTGKIWLGLLDSSHVPVGDPLKIFQGRIDVTDVEIGETVTINITLESRLVDWERPRIRRYTDQDQKKAYPGDRGFEFVQAVADMELVWGRG